MVTAASEAFAAWIGQGRHSVATVSGDDVSAMAATLGTAAVVGTVPSLGHWLTGGPIVPQEDLGPDGHERLGLFLPPFPATVRMWASGTLRFHRPLVTDVAVCTETLIADVRQRTGRSGMLHFVDLDHSYSQSGALAIEERQTLVYRPERAFARPAPTIAPAGRQGPSVRLSDLQLFRYSALTFNSHRIHLDRRYCEAWEGDPRLVAHAPLLATLLATAAEAVLPWPLAVFSFRAHHPVREDESFHIRADEPRDGSCEFWIAGDDGTLRMSALAASAGAASGGKCPFGHLTPPS